MAARSGQQAASTLQQRAPGNGRQRGIVVQALGPQWVVATGDGTVRCVARRSLRRALERPVVGDLVEIEPIGGDMGCIVDVLPRKNRLRRADVHRGGRREQVIAANVDQLLIVGSTTEPPLNPGLMDRYLVAAWRDGIRPILCVSKVDLPMSARARTILESFGGLDIPIVRTSAVTGAGLEDLRVLLEGMTTVLAGLSGTGKTTLVRHLTGDHSLEVGEISAATGRGRHVTTSARLLPLVSSAGGYVIDLPGQRVFGLGDLTEEDLLRGFPDLERAGECRLPGCSHGSEPGCALVAAVERGLVPARRLEAFRRIWKNLEDEVAPGTGRPGR